MKFEWGRALYRAFKTACIGAAIGLVTATVLAGSAGGSEPAFGYFTLMGFWIAGVVGLAWEAFSKSYPDA